MKSDDHQQNTKNKSNESSYPTCNTDSKSIMERIRDKLAQIRKKDDPNIYPVF